MVAKDGITQTEADSQTFTDIFIYLFFVLKKKGPGRRVTIK